jgi:hypothetical protein
LSLPGGRAPAAPLGASLQAPWDVTLEKPPADVMNGFPWQLYHVEEDWTQAEDLAAKMPDKLRDMQQRFIMEAQRSRVFPLDDTRLARFISAKPSYSPGRTVFTYGVRSPTCRSLAPAARPTCSTAPTPSPRKSPCRRAGRRAC